MSDIMELLAGFMWFVLLMLCVLVLMYVVWAAGPSALFVIGVAFLVSTIINRLGL